LNNSTIRLALVSPETAGITIRKSLKHDENHSKLPLFYNKPHVKSKCAMNHNGTSNGNSMIYNGASMRIKCTVTYNGTTMKLKERLPVVAD